MASRAAPADPNVSRVSRVTSDPPLKEVADALGVATADIRKWTRSVRREVADLVDDEATAKARSLGGVHAHVAVTLNSLRPKIETRNATLLLGGRKKDGAAAGSEFGAKQYPQFPAWKGNDENAGYYVWPTIRDLIRTKRLEDLYTDAIRKGLESVEIITSGLR